MTDVDNYPEYDEYVTTFKDFHVEFRKIKDMLSNAEDIARAVSNDPWQNTESKIRGIGYLNSLLSDVIAKCERAAEILEEGDYHENC